MRFRLLGLLFTFLILGTCAGYAQWVSIGPDSGETSITLSFDNSTNNLFLGTAEGFWYYNEGSGVWTRREDVGWIGRSVFAIAAHPTIPGRVITGRMNAFFKGYLEYSNDWGVTNNYSYSSNGGNVTDIKNVPGSPNTFFAVTWQDVSPGELLRSTDGGQNWVLLPNYIHFTMTEMAIDKNNPAVMYVSGDERVTKTTNGGTNWSVTSDGLPAGLGVYSVSVSPGNSQILLASNDNGIYRSTNAGTSWTLTGNFSVQHFEFNPVNPMYAAAVTFSPYKVLLSSDAGLTWTDFTGNYSGDEVSDLAFNTAGNKLYVSSRMNGVFVHDFSFVPVELVSFTAQEVTGSVVLEWETASELNNKGFEIERSANSAWEKIGFIEGKGTVSGSSRYSFTDNSTSEGKYLYRLKQINYDGTFEYSPEVEIIISVPEEFALLQNYPNPFNPVTSIRYTLSSSQFVELKVYDIIGNEAALLVNEQQPAGTYDVKFDASGLTSGVYFYKIITNDFTSVRKMILLR